MLTLFLKIFQKNILINIHIFLKKCAFLSIYFMCNIFFHVPPPNRPLALCIMLNHVYFVIVA